MGEDTLVVVIFGTLHLIGIGFAVLLLAPLMREEQPLWLPPQDDEDGGGGNDRVTPEPPRGPSGGGIPLLDAAPARVRLRGPGRLSELTPLRDRRPTHAPSPTPRREPSRGA